MSCEVLSSHNSESVSELGDFHEKFQRNMNIGNIKGNGTLFPLVKQSLCYNKKN